MKKLAFVTCSTKPDFAPDDVSVVHALQRRGADVQAIPWDGGLIDWKTFDRVVLRSCWNYHKHPNEFRQWLDELEKQGVNLCNPASIVKWNMHKGYLRELERHGVVIPETVWAPKKSGVQLADTLKTRSWTKAVVKPAISATAFNTFLVSAEEADAKQIAFNELNETSDLLLQKFMPEVQREGEWSLLFFDKQFSHAVIKKAKANDFRVQNDFGGTFQAAAPPDFILQQAANILALVKEPLLYARIDGVVSNGQFVLMELELIEPVLFLDQKEDAAERLAGLMV